MGIMGTALVLLGEITRRKNTVKNEKKYFDFYSNIKLIEDIWKKYYIFIRMLYLFFELGNI